MIFVYPCRARWKSLKKLLVLWTTCGRSLPTQSSSCRPTNLLSCEQLLCHFVQGNVVCIVSAIFKCTIIIIFLYIGALTRNLWWCAASEQANFKCHTNKLCWKRDTILATHKNNVIPVNSIRRLCDSYTVAHEVTKCSKRDSLEKFWCNGIYLYLRPIN